MEPISAAIMGGASILGGLLGKKKGMHPAQQIAIQEESNLRQEKASFDQKMQLAKTHGLHPLSVLGVPMSSFTPAISLDGPSGPDMSAIGYGVGQIGQSLVNPKGEGPEQPQQPVNDPRQDRLINARIDLAETQAEQAKFNLEQSKMDSMLHLFGQPGRPPGVVQSNDGNYAAQMVARQSGLTTRQLGGSGVKIEQTVQPPHPTIAGHTAAANQAYSRLVDRDGFLMSIPNPDVFNPDIEKYGTFYALQKRLGTSAALDTLALLENAGAIGGGILGAAGLYRYFGNQRREAEARQQKNRAGQSWRGRSSRSPLRSSD